MATLAVMGKANDAPDRDPFLAGFRLHARSLSPIVAGMENAIIRLNRDQVRKFRGRTLKLTPVMNALALEFLAMSPADQNALIHRRMPELEALAGHVADGPGLPATTPPPAARVEYSDLSTPPAAASPNGRKAKKRA